jgi:peptide/nickel transport system permease protein
MSTIAAALSRGDWMRSGTGWILGSPRLNLWVGAITVSFLVMVGLLAPWIAPYDLSDISWEAILQEPGAAHPLGTDDFGRDILSRVIYAARTNLLVAGLSALFPFAIGTVIGSLPGVWGRWADYVVGLDADVDIVFPSVAVLAIFVGGPSLVVFVAVLSLAGWIPYARLTRMPALKARRLGAAACLVFALSDVVLAMFLIVALSYLGLGVRPPTVEWGAMILEGRDLIASAWWVAIFPILAVMVAALGFSMLADGLAERFGLRKR